MNLVEGFLDRLKVGDSYVKSLQQYVSHISCGSVYEITPAKSFEIMASGSVLFTNRFQGIGELFPEDCYCSYENDMSDVEQKARMILSDTDYVKETVKKAKSCIISKHSHKIRSLQLMKELRNLLC